VVAFQDVTDSVNSSASWIERNERLVEATKIKIDFVHHVSYELRCAHNIIGFAHFLDDPATEAALRKKSELSRLHHGFEQIRCCHHQTSSISPTIGAAP